MFLKSALSLSVFLPLVSSIYAILVRRFFLAKTIVVHTTLLLFCSSLLSFYVLLTFYSSNIETLTINLWQWIQVGDLSISFSLYLDSLVLIMLVMITTISFFVHFYCINYMEKDYSAPRFMSYMGLFTFFMLFLVSSSTLVQLFFGWEGVGLCSYLLIGYFYNKETANKAANKSFIVNRVSDLGLLLGILLCFCFFHTLDIQNIISNLPTVKDKSIYIFGEQLHLLSIIAFLFLFGAMGKSAQFGFHIWLPDAMEGPTPASALIHAATMVTAGVFLLVRLSPIYENCQEILYIVALIGLVTALFSGAIALVQNDIKKIVAYSTCSQLGMMFFAVGLQAYAIAIFHLVVHACFKALLFLGAGSVIHAMSGEQNIENMGGLSTYIPKTYVLFWVGILALIGMPFFGGYYSKDAIMEVAWAYGGVLGNIIYYGGLLAILITALYAIRLVLLVFHGQVKAHDTIAAHISESSGILLLPMGFLAVLSTFSGFFFNRFFVENIGNFWRNSIDVSTQINLLQKIHSMDFLYFILPTGIGFLGVVTAWTLFRRDDWITKFLKEKSPKVYKFFYNKWYVDEFYEKIVVLPYNKVALFLYRYVDRGFIDKSIIKRLSLFILRVSKKFTSLQTGYLSHYILAMIVGIVCILWFYQF